MGAVKTNETQIAQKAMPKKGAAKKPHKQQTKQKSPKVSQNRVRQLHNKRRKDE